MLYRTDGPWGVGKGAPLTAEEGDQNMWELMQRIDALEDLIATGNAVGITSIEVIGNAMMIHLSNGTDQGPFVLPTAMIRFRGEAVTGMNVIKNDVVTVKGRGVYFVLKNHTVVLPFDPDRVDAGDALYSKMFGEDTYIYDISFFFPGKPGQGVGEGDNFMEHLFNRATTIPAGLVGSLAKLDVAAASLLVFPIRQNGNQIGTITFANGSTGGVLAWTTDNVKSFVAGDRFQIGRASTGVDATAKGLTVSIKASTVTG